MLDNLKNKFNKTKIISYDDGSFNGEIIHY